MEQMNDAAAQQPAPRTASKETAATGRAGPSTAAARCLPSAGGRCRFGCRHCRGSNSSPRCCKAPDDRPMCGQRPATGRARFCTEMQEARRLILRCADEPSSPVNSLQRWQQMLHRSAAGRGQPRPGRRTPRHSPSSEEIDLYIGTCWTTPSPYSTDRQRHYRRRRLKAEMQWPARQRTECGHSISHPCTDKKRRRRTVRMARIRKTSITQTCIESRQAKQAS